MFKFIKDQVFQPVRIDEDPFKENEEFLKHHKELNLDGNIYCADAIKRIEAHCGCKVICNPHFNGISFFVENKYHQDAQDIINKLDEEDRKKTERQKRLETKKAEAMEKAKKRFDEAMAKCDHPNDDDSKFAEDCLKTLRFKDYVQPQDAERYRRLYAGYPEYFKLLSWPEDVQGNAAKTYLNSTLIKNI